MKIRIALFAALVSLTACSTVTRVSDCATTAAPAFYDADAADLTLVVAAPGNDGSETPFLSLGEVGDHPALIVNLERVDAIDQPAASSPSNCAASEVHAYVLDVDADEWSAYWSISKEERKFVGGIGIA